MLMLTLAIVPPREPPSRTVVTWAGTQQPAASLVVQAGSTLRVTDERGGVELPDVPFVVVRDSGSGLALYAGPPAPAIEANAPVKVSVDLRAFGPPDDLVLHVGSGPSTPVESVHFAMTLARLARHGPIDLPLIASEWRVYQPGPEGFVDSDWVVPGDGRVDLVVRTGAGVIGTARVEVPADHAPYAVIRASVAPTPDHELVVRRPEIGVQTAAILIAPSAADDLDLALRFRVDPVTSAFAAGVAPIPLLTAETRIPRLAVDGPAHVGVHSVLEGVDVRVPVTLEGDTVAVTLTRRVLVGTRRGAVRGIATGSDGKPAAGATIEVRSEPHGWTTTAGPDGSWRIDEAVLGRPARISILGEAGAVVSSYRVDALGAESPVAVGVARDCRDWANWTPSDEFTGGAPPDDGYLPFFRLSTAGGTLIPGTAYSVWGRTSKQATFSGQVRFSVAPPTDVLVQAEFAPGLEGSAVAKPPNFYFAVRPYLLYPEQALYSEAHFQFFYQETPKPNLEVEFPSSLADPDPYEYTTDASGIISMSCINAPRLLTPMPISVVMDDANGTLERDIECTGWATDVACFVVDIDNGTCTQQPCP